MANEVPKSHGCVNIDVRRINSGDHTPSNALPQPERIVDEMGAVSDKDALRYRRRK